MGGGVTPAWASLANPGDPLDLLHRVAGRGRRAGALADLTSVSPDVRHVAILVASSVAVGLRHANPDRPRRMGCWCSGSCSTKSTDRRRCRPRCPRRTDATWMDASVAPRRRLGRLRRMTRTGWVRRVTRIRRLDPVRGGQHRRRKTREPQLPARASRPRLSCLPPRGRHCLYTINAAAPVRVSDYLRRMPAAERGRPARWRRSLAARCPTAAEGWGDPSWRLRLGEAGEFTAAGPAAPVLAAGSDPGCQRLQSAAGGSAGSARDTSAGTRPPAPPKSRRAAGAPMPIASPAATLSAARERNFWLVQPFSMNGPTDGPGADDLVAPCTRVGPPRTPFAGGPVRTAGASGARVTHDSVGRFGDLATDIDK